MKNIVILSESAGFPWGMAASTRVRNIGKALLDQGLGVRYVGLRGATVSVNGPQSPTGVEQGIRYHYPGGWAIRPGSWWVRRLDDLTAQRAAARLVRKLHRKGEAEQLLLYTRDPKVVHYWSRMGRRLDIPVVLEICEWPLANVPPGKKPHPKQEQFCHESPMKVDAVLPISNYIAAQVDNVLNSWDRLLDDRRQHPAMFRVPILTDHPALEADGAGGAPDPSPYLLYAGAASYTDIAQMVIDIMAALQERGSALKLRFTGGGDPKTFRRLREYAEEQGVAERIEFTGFLDEEELFDQMQQAVCLLAPLPDIPQSRARFPTKIGYYLASGTPVVTNRVGSVSEYLTDGINAVIAPSFEADAFAGAVQSLVDDPKQALLIGRNGKALARRDFYYKNACKGLGDFLASLPRKT